MRGRTNIPPRIGGIVNGAVKQCVVASGNDIKIGDYVQLNLREGALPEMLKDTGATNSSNTLSDWLFYGFKTFALSDGNIINISLYSASSGSTIVASQVVLVDSTGIADGIRVTQTTVTQGSLDTSDGYGCFSVCRLREDCFLVIHSAYSEYQNYCRACLVKYSPSTKTVTGASLDTTGITDTYFKGYGFYSSSTSYMYNALGVVNDRVVRFVTYYASSGVKTYAYEVYVDESAATLTCKQLTIDYGSTGLSVMTDALQAFEEFSDGYFGLVYNSGAYCKLAGDVVTVLQCSPILPGTKIMKGVYASGAAYSRAMETEELTGRTLSDVTIEAGATLSTLGSTYVGKTTYDVVIKASAISKQLDTQDTWEEDYYSAATSYDKTFTYFGIVFVKCGEGLVLGIMPAPQIAFLNSSYSGSSQQQLMTGCYCGVFSFDEATQRFTQSVLTFDTFIAFKEPVLIQTLTASSSYKKGYTLCGIESAFIVGNVARIGLWFYSRYNYSNSYTFHEKFMPFTIKVADGKVVDFSDKNIVEKYTHNVFGIAKTGGANGATIEVYMPQ